MQGSLTLEAKALLDRARREGRTHLDEPEGLALLAGLGLRVPRHAVVPDGAAAARLDLSAFPGAKVVVKVASDAILHKSDVGGVAVVAKDASAVAAAVDRMLSGLRGRRARGCGVYEFVPHEPALGGQLLLGARTTGDFGPVVTLGAGGIHAEFLAAQFRPGHSLAICSPALAEPEGLERALAPVAVVRLLTEGLRGEAPRARLADLAALVGRFLAFAREAMPHEVEEVEVNPLVLDDGVPVALDAVVKVGRGPRPAPAPRPVEKVDRLLHPRSIAVVGVSEKMNPGRQILQNVLRAGFPPDRTFVVKRGREEIDGCRCFPSVAALPEAVDLLVVAVDAAQVAAVVAQATALAKAETMILIPGGMGELPGTEGHVERIRAAVAAARGTPGRGPLLNGGNCLGARSVPGRYDTLFIPQHKLSFPAVPPAPLAFVSQSGAFAVARSSQLWSLNPRYCLTIGNQADLTAGDYLEHLAGRDDLRVMAFYMEGFRPGDGLRWVQAARRVTASGRAVVLYRAGRTSAGAEASASHTASLAGDYAVTRALAEQAGVLLAESLEEFQDLVGLAVRLDGRPFRGLTLGAVSNAGFECVAMADALASFRLAALAPATRARIAAVLAKARLDGVVGVKNPLDLTPILGDEGTEEAVRAVLDDPGVDLGVVGIVPLSGAIETLAPGPAHGEDLARATAVGPRLVRLFAEGGKPWVAVVDAGPPYDALARHLEAHGVPTFRAADRAVRAFEKYARWRVGAR